MPENYQNFKKLILKGPGVSQKQETASSNNHAQNISDKLLFSCEIAHYGKSLISVFQEILASIDKSFMLGGRLGTLL